MDFMKDNAMEAHVHNFISHELEEWLKKLKQ